MTHRRQTSKTTATKPDLFQCLSNEDAPLEQLTGYQHSTKRALSKRTFVMLGSFLLGILLALTHHLFYQYLSGKDIGNTISQRWVNRIGTGLAFLVKMFLVIASSTAYVQRQWLSFHNKALKVSHIDVLSGILGNATKFSHFQLWLMHPWLLLIAIITW